MFRSNSLFEKIRVYLRLDHVSFPFPAFHPYLSLNRQDCEKIHYLNPFVQIVTFGHLER